MQKLGVGFHSVNIRFFVLTMLAMRHQHSQTSPADNKPSRGLSILTNCSFLTCRYLAVVLISKCPIRSLMYFISMPLSKRWVAKLWRRLWNVTSLWIFDTEQPAPTEANRATIKSTQKSPAETRGLQSICNVTNAKMIFFLN
jgi:hypothetical protein